MKKQLIQYISQPRARIRQMSLATGGFFVGVLALYIASYFESQLLFYIAAGWMIIMLSYGAPAYVAFLAWRLWYQRHARMDE
ncbi:MAG: hypothetical protein V2I33_10850 [Kangiellaceae bacterium]|jgi:hypothetical protein|nr:hypothetical protein [Kangiellaceae bacterium]